MKNAILNSFDCCNIERPEDTLTESELKELLALYIDKLLDNNQINELLNILYRIDINEDKFNTILFGNISKTPIAIQIATLIIERQKLKLYYREKFKQKK